MIFQLGIADSPYTNVATGSSSQGDGMMYPYTETLEAPQNYSQSPLQQNNEVGHFQFLLPLLNFLYGEDEGESQSQDLQNMMAGVGDVNDSHNAFSVDEGLLYQTPIYPTNELQPNYTLLEGVAEPVLDPAFQIMEEIQPPWLSDSNTLATSSSSGKDVASIDDYTEEDVQECLEAAMRVNNQIDNQYFNSQGCSSEGQKVQDDNPLVSEDILHPLPQESSENTTPNERDAPSQSLENQTIQEKVEPKAVAPSLPKKDEMKEPCWTCDECGKAYKRKCDLTAHRKRPHLDKETTGFSCDACPKTYHYLNDLLKHVQKIHEDAVPNDQKPLTCTKCKDEKFVTNFMFQKHLKGHLRDGKWDISCTKCQIRFKDEESLAHHNKKKHASRIEIEKNFHCRCCKTAFANETLRASHERKQHRYIFIFSCDRCDKVYSDTLHLDTHNKTHDRFEHFRERLDCSVCQSEFGDRDALAEHLLIHTGEEKLRCDYCPERFLSLQNLGSHLMSHHNVEKPFKCSVCGESFTHNYERYICITYHKSSELELFTEKEKNYRESVKDVSNDPDPDAKLFKECQICWKKFKSGSFLYHLDTHKQDKKFSCSVCKLGFYAKSLLVTHMRSHTGERPFKCPYCNNKFAQQGTLKRHLTVHEKGGKVKKPKD